MAYGIHGDELAACVDAICSARRGFHLPRNFETGCVLPIRVRDPYAGSVVALISGIKKLKRGYSSDGFEELCEKMGSYTFNRRILFENR